MKAHLGALGLSLLACGSEPPAPTSSSSPVAASQGTSTATTGSATPSASAAPAPSPGASVGAANKWTFDGISVGDTLASVLARAPFQKPCGDSSINGGQRRLISFLAKDCDGRTFPNKTTAILFVPRKEGPDRDAEPVEAVAWVGGTHFEPRSQFAGKMGMSVADLEAALGPGRVLATTIEDGNLGRHGRRTDEGVTLTARKHPGEVHSLTEREVAIGFVVGAMPNDPNDERWRMIAQLYRKFTKGL